MSSRKTHTTRTMYMHTLDNAPASYADHDGPYIYFVGGRNRVTLVPTLGRLRREQALAIAASTGRWAEHGRYGYVLVEVPS